MNSQALKVALAADIKAIRMLSPDIIPARLYYSALFKTSFGFFWKIWLVIAGAFAFPCFNYPVPSFSPQFLIGQSLVVGLFFSLIALLVLQGAINSCLLFQFHLKKHLKTGVLIDQKIKLIATIFLGSFSCLCAFFSVFCETVHMLFMVPFSFFLSIGITCFFINMEVRRIGLSTMYTVINEFFTKTNRC